MADRGLSSGIGMSVSDPVAATLGVPVPARVPIAAGNTVVPVVAVPSSVPVSTPISVPATVSTAPAVPVSTAMPVAISEGLME
jgi:hypothetical protein